MIIPLLRVYSFHLRESGLSCLQMDLNRLETGLTKLVQSGCVNSQICLRVPDIKDIKTNLRQINYTSDQITVFIVLQYYVQVHFEGITMRIKILLFIPK